MRFMKSFICFLLIISLSLFSISCGKSAEKPAPKSEEEPKPVPPEIEEIEGDIIAIMEQVDLVPYYEKQIAEKEKKKKEKIELEILIGKKSESNGGEEKSQEGGGSEEEKKSEGNSIDKLIEFKPAPITLDDVLLKEIIKAEKTEKEEDKKQQEIPDDIKAVWHEINTKIMGLHGKWNSLEPQVSKVGTSQEKIKDFENNLNLLTMSGSENKFIETLLYANKLTSFIPNFVNNFKKKFPTSIYYLKYHTRQVVLDSSANEFTKATENINKINIYKDSLVSELIEKKLSDPANKLTSSVLDLEEAIKTKNINIIKIKASIVMKNINSAKEELSK